MYNRRYDKVFLMLRQETAGYAVGKRPPWGSCIMELNLPYRAYVLRSGENRCFP